MLPDLAHECANKISRIVLQQEGFSLELFVQQANAPLAVL
jgi:hypothetical protein